MSSVFIKVPVSERLPKERCYVVIINTLGSIDNLYHYENGKFSSSHVSPLNPDRDRTFEVEFWLEEIELPTYNQVDIESVKYYGNAPGEISINIFKHGANFILKKLKGGL